MSTAHRPTWAPSRGHEEQGGNRLYFSSKYISIKDISVHIKLKRRQSGQGSSNELKKIDVCFNFSYKDTILFFKSNIITKKFNNIKDNFFLYSLIFDSMMISFYYYII